MYLIGTVLFWIFFLICMVLLFFPAALIWLVTLPFDKNKKVLKQGGSIMIFPEGTRTKDGRLGKFRYGAFLLSQKSNAPVVPIAIEGSRDVFSDEVS